MNYRPNPFQYADYARETAWASQKFPVDPVTVAEFFGVPVYELDLPGNVSGAIRKMSGRDPEIYVNAGDSDARKRFTIAHECGHFFYNSETGRSDFDYVDFRNSDSSSGTKDEEIFANQFAAQLLMPSEAVTKKFQKTVSIPILAQYFGVSAEAMKFRLQNLRLICA